MAQLFSSRITMKLSAAQVSRGYITAVVIVYHHALHSLVFTINCSVGIHGVVSVVRDYSSHHIVMSCIYSTTVYDL